MEKGAINGIPCWLQVAELTGGERTIVKEAPGVDGARVETQGQGPERYRLQFCLIRDNEWIVDDPETATLNLRAMLLSGGPFTVDMPTFDEVEDLWLASPYSLTFFDADRLRIANGSFELIQAKPEIRLQESTLASVKSAVTTLSKASAQDFGRREPEFGYGLTALGAVEAGLDWADNVQAQIAAAFGPVNDVAGALQNIRSTLASLIGTPQNFASQLMGTFVGLLSLLPSLSQADDLSTGSAAAGDLGGDKPTSVLVGALEDGAAFDDDLPPTQADTLGDEASEEDLAEQDEVNAAKSLVLVAIAASTCLAATSTNFATVQSVLAVAEALEPVFAKLLDLEDIDHRVLKSSRFLWKSTLAFLAEESAKLPRLVTITVGQETDALSILPDLYESLRSEDEVQLAVDSICALNPHIDPIKIFSGTTLRYLDPLIG